MQNVQILSPNLNFVCNSALYKIICWIKLLIIIQSDNSEVILNTEAVIERCSLIVIKVQLFIYFSFFNVDTFSSNTLLIKIDSKLQNLIVKRFNYPNINQYNPHKEQKF